MNSRKVQRIDELARDLPPARDLWPGIAAAIVEAPAARRPRWLPAAGMAAAVALVSVGVWIGHVMTPQTIVKTDVAAPHNQRLEVVVEIKQKLAGMPPAERDKVAGSLATLQHSIQDIEAELGRDPANALLQELLVNSCQEEMRALTVVRDSGRQET